MAMNIDEFKSIFQDGGARTNLYQVVFTNPINSAGDRMVPFTVKATSMPGRTVNKLPLAYFGRAIKVAGVVPEYEDWTVTLYGDEAHTVRDAIEEWSHSINSPIGNVRLLGSSNPNLYKSTANVYHISQTGVVLRDYKITGIWPTSVEPINLAWEGDGVVEYSVTFSVDYWTLGEGSTTGFAGGIDI